MAEPALESTDVSERVVLAELAEWTLTGECPIATLDLLDGCRGRVKELDALVAGRFTEAELLRSCHSLAATELVRENPPEDGSPVGKGRPEYELAVDVETVQEFLSDDDVFADVDQK